MDRMRGANSKKTPLRTFHPADINSNKRENQSKTISIISIEKQNQKCFLNKLCSLFADTIRLKSFTHWHAERESTRLRATGKWLRKSVHFHVQGRC